MKKMVQWYKNFTLLKCSMLLFCYDSVTKTSHLYLLTSKWATIGDHNTFFVRSNYKFKRWCFSDRAAFLTEQSSIFLEMWTSGGVVASVNRFFRLKVAQWLLK